MSEFKSEYVHNLPDTYRKDTESNNYKILNIAQAEIEKIKGDTETVYNSRDLDQARGKTLDQYGEMFGQPRGLATDAQYRTMIKSKITRNIMSGDLNSIINATSIMFGCNPNQVEITEMETPATVKIAGLPYNIINYAGLSVNQTLELIQKLIPAGVGVESIELNGTFEFGTTDSEYDETKGFAISETDQSIGGYLGLINKPDQETPLPI